MTRGGRTWSYRIRSEATTSTISTPETRVFLGSRSGRTNAVSAEAPVGSVMCLLDFSILCQTNKMLWRGEHRYPAIWMHAMPAKINSDPHSFIRANGSRNSAVPSTAANTTPMPRTAAT